MGKKYHLSAGFENTTQKLMSWTIAFIEMPKIAHKMEKDKGVRREGETVVLSG